MVEGDGPKYDNGTLVPTDAGAGKRLQPAPGPMGPGPDPWSVLNVLDSVVAVWSISLPAVGLGRFRTACIAVTCSSGIPRFPKARVAATSANTGSPRRPQ